MPIRTVNGLDLYQSDIFSDFKNLTHGFTTRRGGVSRGAYESLSMSPRRGDDNENVRQNEKIVCAALNFNHDKLTSTRQEHTDNIKFVDKTHIGYGVHKDWGEGVDGIITIEKNVPLLCYSADCVPILFYASDICAIAAVHAGWRGSAMKIASKCVKMIKEAGAETENIYAAIGPCIGKCCYEVDSEVAYHFDEQCFLKKENGKFMLDLVKSNEKMLMEEMIPAENISVSGICTKCRNDLFFSHRAQHGKSGTLGGIICINEE